MDDAEADHAVFKSSKVFVQVALPESQPIQYWAVLIQQWQHNNKQMLLSYEDTTESCMFRNSSTLSDFKAQPHRIGTCMYTMS